jgi:hypothetical protein
VLVFILFVTSYHVVFFSSGIADFIDFHCSYCFYWGTGCKADSAASVTSYLKINIKSRFGFGLLFGSIKGFSGSSLRSPFFKAFSFFCFSDCSRSLYRSK